ncbi:MAG: 23S rRNA (adenine(2503)-C(2))-methyltransferase RlmN [Candidatus Rifleibacteriota bacterium]
MSYKSLLAYTYSDFKKIINDLGMPAFRAKQVWEWVFSKFVFSFDKMTNLSKEDRAILQNKFPSILPPVKNTAYSKDGTIKILVGLEDQYQVEAVAIPDDNSLTFCLSSQVGCPVGCAFCNTGHSGFKRNLTGEEIILQVMMLINQTGRKPTNIVFMGMGEPFLNKKSVFAAITKLTEKNGLGMATRRITISTSGIIDGIYDLIDRPGEVNLAVSLHSVNDQNRTRLVPINRKYPLNRLRQAIEEYCDITGRRVTFEIVLIDKVNDQENDARNLANFCQGLICHVNLVRFNPFPNSDFVPSSKENEKEFRKILKKSGIPVTIRNSKGSDILAACGQLSDKNNSYE